MRLKKQMIVASLCTAMLFQAGIPVAAKEERQTDTAQTKASYQKKENVYAKLNADGTTEDAYVINHFTVKKAGMIKDYGDYANVENLTDLNILKQKNDQTTIDAKKGEFYYQGTIQDVKLPWSVEIRYELDGKNMLPEELGGRSGALKIYISLKQNKDQAKDFSDHYVTQISLTLDNEKAKNIKAKDATIADAGADTQLSFTVLPGKEADYMIKADVKNFSMSGFSIAAVPYSMNINLDDYGINDMTGQFDKLISATEQLNTGMSKLSSGMKQLDTNSSALLKGYNQINSGIGTLSGNSSTLVNGSKQIENALSVMASSMAGADFSSMSQLKQLPTSMDQMSSGLKNLRSGLLKLRQGFDTSYNILDEQMKEASQTTLTQEELSEMKTLSKENSAVQKLLDSYHNEQKIIGIWNQVKPAFTAVSTSLNANNKDSVISGLDQVISGLDQMSTALNKSLKDVDIEKQMTSLSKGLNQLSKSYASFHKGLGAYTKGVSSLYQGSSKYGAGLTKYFGGIASIDKGSETLSNGMGQYTEGVTKIPDNMQEKIDEMMKEYESSDYKQVSFADNRNKNVKSVQFIISTQEIKAPEVKKAEKKQKKEGFFDRLKALF